MALSGLAFGDFLGDLSWGRHKFEGVDTIHICKYNVYIIYTATNADTAIFALSIHISTAGEYQPKSFENFCFGDFHD